MHHQRREADEEHAYSLAIEFHTYFLKSGRYAEIMLLSLALNYDKICWLFIKSCIGCKSKWVLVLLKHLSALQ